MSTAARDWLVPLPRSACPGEQHRRRFVVVVRQGGTGLRVRPRRCDARVGGARARTFGSSARALTFSPPKLKRRCRSLARFRSHGARPRPRRPSARFAHRPRRPSSFRESGGCRLPGTRLRRADAAFLVIPPNFTTPDFRAYQRTVWRPSVRRSPRPSCRGWCHCRVWAPTFPRAPDRSPASTSWSTPSSRWPVSTRCTCGPPTSSRITCSASI